MILIWVILGVIALVLLQEKLYRSFWDKNLSVDLAFSEESVMQGERCVLFERVENRKVLPLPVLKVKFQVSRNLVFEEKDGGSSVTDLYYRNDVLSIRPNMRHVRKLIFRCKKRGFYTINGVDLVAGDLFLTHEFPKSLPAHTQLYVYPRPFAGQEFIQAVQKLNGEILSRRHLLEDPFEYRGIREYSPRDTMRDINWKATARTGELKVNMKNYTALKAVRIFLNLEDGALLRNEKLLEAAICMAAGAAEQFLGQGIRTALYTNGSDILTGKLICLPAASGTGHMESVNRSLARIDLTESAPSFVAVLRETVLEKTEAAEELFTIFISPDVKEDFQQLLCECGQNRMEFTWLCPESETEPVQIRPELERYTRRLAWNEE